MRTKDILKSPLYLITLVICICFAGAFLVSAFGQDDEIVEKENKKLDDAYFAVLEKFELTEEEIDSCSISYEKNTENDNEESCVYQIITTIDEEERVFTVTFFSNEYIEVVENGISDLPNDDEDSGNNKSELSANTSNSQTSNSKESSSSQSKYVSKELVKSQVLKDSENQVSDVHFISIELDEKQIPPIYEVVFESKNGYRRYIYQVNALTGLLRHRTYYNQDDLWDEENIFYHIEGEDDDNSMARLWDADCRTNKGGQSYYNEPVYPEGFEPTKPSTPEEDEETSLE